MQHLTTLLLQVAFILLIPEIGGRHNHGAQAHARVLHTEGHSGEYQTYLESLFIEAGLEPEWGSTLMQQGGGNGRSFGEGRQLLEDPQCATPEYTTCYIADGSKGYCCPQNANGDGKFYGCKSHPTKFKCVNKDDEKDEIEVKDTDGSGKPGGSAKKKTISVPEVDSPEACYTQFPGTAGICGLECGKAYCCPPEAPFCNGVNQCLTGEKRLHQCTALTGY